MSEESGDGGDAERGAVATVSIVRNADGAATATDHASAARGCSAGWPPDATSTFGAQICVVHDCAGFGAVGAGQSGVQQAIAGAATAAATLAAVKHPIPPADPVKISASSTAATLRIVPEAYPPFGHAATPAEIVSRFILGRRWTMTWDSGLPNFNWRSSDLFGLPAEHATAGRKS